MNPAKGVKAANLFGRCMMIELLKKLIQIKSDTKAGANEALLFCADWLKEHGQDVNVHENGGYLMLTAAKGHGSETIVWNGHVDVVPGCESQFIPVEKMGRLYGRGAADMKAGVAAMMQAFVELDPSALTRTVQLHIVTDEEIGGHNTSEWLVAQGFTGDFVICGEPTSLKIGLQSKGVLHMDLAFKGKPAHGSRPWEGLNAIECAMMFHHKLAELPFQQASSEYFARPSVNLAMINAGTRYNVVPDLCRLSYDIRFLPGQDPEEIIQEMIGLANSLGLAMDYQADSSTPALATGPKHPYIKTLQSAIQKTIHSEPVLFGQHGAADTRYYAVPLGGEGAIEFGPSGADWHGDEEYVVISSIFDYKEILLLQALS
jgi:succinyl-diaminopimelate desuccinylase